jgi:hypothetical protein
MSRALGVVLGLMLVGGHARAQDVPCPAIMELISGMSEAIAEAELEQAGALASQVKTAALCQSQPHQTMLLAQMFRMSGTTAYFSGDMAAASEAFALAASISPGEDLETVFGRQVGVFYGGIRDKLVAEPGASIKLVGEAEAWIDGRPMRAGVARDVTAGPHILQTREADGAMKAETITLAGAEERVLSLGVATTPAATSIAPTAAASSSSASSGDGLSRRTLMLGGGGALVAAGAGMLFLASSTHGEFDDETDPSRLEGLQSRTNTMATLGMLTGVAGIGVVGMGTWIQGSDGLGIQLQGRF